MATAYATVILPTLNRAATLPYALASVQAQTQRSIEILLVLDGATQACRDIACAAANEDARIRVLDLPKAPASGEANNDYAVKEAAAERIFYIDDDDLFLPRHVESLGTLLDTADIVDSRLCSADRSGGLNLGVACASNPRTRQLLGDFTIKMLYDTHIAHRKDAHGKFATWVPATGESRRPVWDFLAGFANDPRCRWASHGEVTAISLHGAVRRDMDAASRTTEIAHWSNCVNTPAALAKAFEGADSAFNLFRLLRVDRPGGESLRPYLTHRGGYPDVGVRPFETALFALFSGARLPADVAIELAEKLSEPVESGYPFESIAAIFCQCYGPEEATRLLHASSLRSDRNLAARLAAYSAALARADRTAALLVAERACAIGPDPVASLARWRSRLQQELIAGKNGPE